MDRPETRMDQRHNWIRRGEIRWMWYTDQLRHNSFVTFSFYTIVFNRFHSPSTRHDVFKWIPVYKRGKHEKFRLDTDKTLATGTGDEAREFRNSKRARRVLDLPIRFNSWLKVDLLNVCIEPSRTGKQERSAVLLRFDLSLFLLSQYSFYQQFSLCNCVPFRKRLVHSQCDLGRRTPFRSVSNLYSY